MDHSPGRTTKGSTTSIPKTSTDSVPFIPVLPWGFPHPGCSRERPRKPEGFSQNDQCQKGLPTAGAGFLRSQLRGAGRHPGLSWGATRELLTASSRVMGFLPAKPGGRGSCQARACATRAMGLVRACSPSLDVHIALLARMALLRLQPRPHLPHQGSSVGPLFITVLVWKRG